MKVYLTSLIKDEQRYLDEWIEHHLSIGFDKIILYEDFCSTPHDVSKYGDKVLLVNTPECYNDHEKDQFYAHRSRQYVAYTHFNRVFRDECDWWSFLDIDEFVECDNIKDIIDDNYDVISMYWKFYSYSGHIKDPYPGQVYSVRKTYTEIVPADVIKPIAHLNIVFKSLFKSSSKIIPRDCADAKFCIPHSPIPPTWKERTISPVMIGHYWTRSLDEYITRLYSQGLLEDCWWSRKLDDFFVYNKICKKDYKEYVREYQGKKAKIHTDY